MSFVEVLLFVSVIFTLFQVGRLLLSILIGRMIHDERAKLIEMESHVESLNKTFSKFSENDLRNADGIRSVNAFFQDLRHKKQRLESLRTHHIRVDRMMLFYSKIFVAEFIINRIVPKITSNCLHNIVSYWELFQFILPPKTRREAFEPAYNDLKEDYLKAQAYKSKWAKWWLCFCFILRTTFMVGDCFRVFFDVKMKNILLVLVPLAVREIVHRFFGS
jgi:hypothetical protein